MVFKGLKRFLFADAAKPGPVVTPEQMQTTIGVGPSAVASQLTSMGGQAVINSESLLAYYRQMEENDETVGTGLEFLAGAACKQIGTYAHPDPKIQDLVGRCRENVGGILEEYRQNWLMDAMAFGYGTGEYTLAPIEGSWLLSGVWIYDPLTIKFKMGRDPVSNAYKVVEVEQTVSGEKLNIPRDKALVLTHGKTRTPYGRSRLRKAYRWWSMKRNVLDFWSMGLERYSAPTAWGQTSGNTEGMERALAQIHSMGYIVTGMDDKVSFLERSGQGAQDCLNAIEYTNKMIYRTMFLPSLMGGGEQGGSYSLGQVHYEMFENAVNWLARIVAENEIEQLWRPIVEWNFGGQETYGTLPLVDNSTPEEKEIMSRVFMNCVNTGFVEPGADVDWLREQMGFPAVDETAGGEGGWLGRLPSRLPTKVPEGQSAGGE